jgi:hypothetical protein
MRPDDDAASSGRGDLTFCAGRYQLVDKLGGGHGWEAWKVVDRRLARPVTVRTFPAGFQRRGGRGGGAGRVPVPRLARVFDSSTSSSGVALTSAPACGKTGKDQDEPAS